MELASNQKLNQDTQSTFGLKVEQLADLFSLTLDDHDPSREDCVNKRIRKELSRQLSALTFENSLLYQEATDSIGDSQCLTSLFSRELGDVIASPTSRVDELRLIKNCSKRVTLQSVSNLDICIATAIYYAVIACSLVYHDELITRHTPDVLIQAFSQLLEKKWILPELALLLEEASQKCHMK